MHFAATTQSITTIVKEFLPENHDGTSLSLVDMKLLSLFPHASAHALYKALFCNLLRNLLIILVMQIEATYIGTAATRFTSVKSVSELSDNLGAMKPVFELSDSDFALHESGVRDSELSDNSGVERLDNVYCKPNQTKTNKMNTNENIAADAAIANATSKRSKANYDVVRGNVIKELTATPGLTLNQLNAKLGTGTTANYKFPVIYAAVTQLRKEPNAVIFGTGAKKNEGLYLTKEDAAKFKPEPRATIARKADSAFTLEKLVTTGSKADGDKWKVIEGNSELGPIKSAYDAASMVPGTIFRIVQNDGDDHKVIETGTITKAMRKAVVAEPVTEPETVNA